MTLFHHQLYLLTLPAGTDCELHVNLGWVDGPVVRHEVGVIGDSVHVKCHHRELHIDDIVMPLLITYLRGEKQEGGSSLL